MGGVLTAFLYTFNLLVLRTSVYDFSYETIVINVDIFHIIKHFIKKKYECPILYVRLKQSINGLKQSISNYYQVYQAKHLLIAC
jgi:hypothetical protein